MIFDLVLYFNFNIQIDLCGFYFCFFKVKNFVGIVELFNFKIKGYIWNFKFKI